MAAARRPLVAGNWKMNGLAAAAAELEAIIAGAKGIGADLMVCLPATLIAEFARRAAGSTVVIGGQDCHAEAAGAYTGDISAEMLKDAGASAVIVGHSERRTLCGEDDRLVALKFKAAQAAGLIPILFVGETLAEREAGKTEQVVAAQLDAVLEQSGALALTSAVLAYEPVWAIGTGRTATPVQAQKVHAFIRDRIKERDRQTAEALVVLYGGSVNAGNAKELFSIPDIDGGLIGGASLNAEEFLAICAAAQ
jgi:triosephosphate isomerase